VNAGVRGGFVTIENGVVTADAGVVAATTETAKAATMVRTTAAEVRLISGSSLSPEDLLANSSRAHVPEPASDEPRVHIQGRASYANRSRLRVGRTFLARLTFRTPPSTPLRALSRRSAWTPRLDDWSA